MTISDPVKFAARIGAVVCIILSVWFLARGIDQFNLSADTAGVGWSMLSFVWLWAGVRLSTFRFHPDQ